MKLIVALLVFGIIVIFHEFGHFIVAKKNGIVVEELPWAWDRSFLVSAAVRQNIH